MAASVGTTNETSSTSDFLTNSPPTFDPHLRNREWSPFATSLQQLAHVSWNFVPHQHRVSPPSAHLPFAIFRGATSSTQQPHDHHLQLLRQQKREPTSGDLGESDEDQAVGMWEIEQKTMRERSSVLMALEREDLDEREEDRATTPPPSPPLPPPTSAPVANREASEIVARETNMSTTSFPIENPAIFAFWGMMVERFSPATSSGATLAEIVSIISSYMSWKTTMQDAFTQLATLFRENQCLDLYDDFVNLLLRLNVREDFLTKKGVDLSSIPRPKETTMLEDDDNTYERETDDEQPEHEINEDDEDDEEDDELNEKQKRGSKRKRQQPSSTSAPRRKKSGEASVSKRSRTTKAKLPDESGRLRRSPDKWTPEEDEKLFVLMAQHGEGTKLWKQIAEELGTTKDSSQCAQHWRRVLAPNIKKGNWTPEEEEKLIQSVEKHGIGPWTHVARDIGSGRTDIQCRYHYMSQLQSRVSRWSIEEEAHLREQVTRHGGAVGDLSAEVWALVSAGLAELEFRRTPRTARECQDHWTVMQK